MPAGWVLGLLAGAMAPIGAQPHNWQPDPVQAFLALPGVSLALERARASGKANIGPKLAPSWRSSCVAAPVNGATLGGQEGTFSYDLPGRRWRQELCGLNTIFRPDDFICLDQLMLNTSGPYNLNVTAKLPSSTVCTVQPNPHSDFFAPLVGARHIGSGQVAGEICELWFNSINHGNSQLNVSACIGTDGVPRQFNSTSNMAFKAFASQRYTFSNISVGPVGDEVFVPSEVCKDHWPMPPCPGPGAVVSLDLYRVHSAGEPVSLENRDLGDALGDMAFFCELAGVDDSKYVTRWAVRANSSWGPYDICLFRDGANVCLSRSGREVGRESSLALGEGPAGGQCSPNGDVGSWYDFPREGRCPEGAPVGQGGCTWSARPVRTVSARCILEDTGLKASCARERSHAPMLKSAAIFRAALASTDPAKGGCPDALASAWEREPAPVVV